MSLVPEKETQAASAAEFTLDPSIGTIRESYQPEPIPLETENEQDEIPSASPTVVHIQDAHGSLEAQENIEKIVEFFYEKHGVKLFFIEGAAGELKPEGLRFFKDRNSNLLLAERLFRKGILGGAELFLLKRYFEGTPAERLPRLYGAEEPELYRQDFEAYQDVASHKKQSLEALGALRSAIITDASLVFDPELAKFFKEWAFYAEVNADLSRHFETLKRYAKANLDLDLSLPRQQLDWPQLARLAALLNEEKQIDRKRAGEEIAALLAWSRKESLSEQSGIFAELLSGKERTTGHSPIRTQVEIFYDQASRRGFSFDQYPELSRLTGVSILKSEIDASALFRETETLCGRILEKLARSPAEQAVLHRYRDYLLLSSLFSLEATAGDYENIKLKKTRLRQSLSGLSPDLAGLFDRTVEFYDLAGRRNAAIFYKMVNSMKANGSSLAVLITGGFHAPGLRQLFRGNQFGFVDVVPNLSAPGDASDYGRLMMLGLKKDPAKSEINAPRMLDPQILAVAPSYAETVRAEYIKPAVSSILNEMRDIFLNGPAALVNPDSLEAVRSEIRPQTQREISIVRHPLKHDVITIDGPAGAGKGTVARLLARRLGYVHVDLGSIYRTITEKALAENVRIEDEAQIQALLDRTSIDLETSDNGLRIIRDGVDVTDLIRTPEVGSRAADVARHLAVHRFVFQTARRIGEEKPIVIEGRNAGTDIFPDAAGTKFFITASVDERARRRLRDFAGDPAMTIERVRADIEERDRKDMERDVAPLRQADDAIVIDTTVFSADETAGLILGRLNRSESREYKPVFEVYDPAKSRLRLFINEAPSGHFSHDHLNMISSWDGKNVAHRFGEVDSGIDVEKPWETYEAMAGADRDADVYSYHNLYYQDWFVAYDGTRGKLFYRRGEPFEERTYSMFVRWKNEQVSSEDLRFTQRPGEEAGRVAVYRAGDPEKKDISQEIDQAFFGQRLMNNSAAVPLAAVAHQFSDIFQLYRFPQFVEVLRNDDGVVISYKYGEAVGKKELTSMKEADAAAFRQVFENDGLMSIDLKPYYQGGITRESLEKEALGGSGYRSVSPRAPARLAPGEYFIERGILHIKLLPYPYPHNLVGITESGKVFAAVITGDKFEGLGVSIQELPEKIQTLYRERHPELAETDPVESVFLLANSRDAFRRKVEQGKGRFAEASARPYLASTAALAFIHEKERPLPQPAPSRFKTLELLVREQGDNWENIKKRGFIAFDMQKTLVARKKIAEPEMIELLAWLLGEGIRIVINSGNTEKEVMTQVIEPLRKYLEGSGRVGDLERVAVFANSGTLMMTFDGAGKPELNWEYQEKLALPDAIQQEILEALEAMADKHFWIESHGPDAPERLRMLYDNDTAHHPELAYELPWLEGKRYVPSAYLFEALFSGRTKQIIAAPYVQRRGLTPSGRATALAVTRFLPEMRPRVMQALRERLSRGLGQDVVDALNITGGGESTIDIFSVNANKALALVAYKDFVKKKWGIEIDPGLSFYVGDELTYHVANLLLDGGHPGNDMIVLTYDYPDKAFRKIRGVAVSPEIPHITDNEIASRMFYVEGGEEKATLRYLKALRTEVERARAAGRSELRKEEVRRTAAGEKPLPWPAYYRPGTLGWGLARERRGSGELYMTDFFRQISPGETESAFPRPAAEGPLRDPLGLAPGEKGGEEIEEVTVPGKIDLTKAEHFFEEAAAQGLLPADEEQSWWYLGSFRPEGGKDFLDLAGEVVYGNKAGLFAKLIPENLFAQGKEKEFSTAAHASMLVILEEPYRGTGAIAPGDIQMIIVPDDYFEAAAAIFGREKVRDVNTVYKEFSAPGGGEKFTALVPQYTDPVLARFAVTPKEHQSLVIVRLPAPEPVKVRKIRIRWEYRRDLKERLRLTNVPDTEPQPVEILNLLVQHGLTSSVEAFLRMGWREQEELLRLTDLEPLQIQAVLEYIEQEKARLSGQPRRISLAEMARRELEQEMLLLINQGVDPEYAEYSMRRAMRSRGIEFNGFGRSEIRSLMNDYLMAARGTSLDAVNETARTARNIFPATISKGFLLWLIDQAAPETPEERPADLSQVRESAQTLARMVETGLLPKGGAVLAATTAGSIDVRSALIISAIPFYAALARSDREGNYKNSILFAGEGIEEIQKRVSAKNGLTAEEKNLAREVIRFARGGASLADLIREELKVQRKSTRPKGVVGSISEQDVRDMPDMLDQILNAIENPVDLEKLSGASRPETYVAYTLLLRDLGAAVALHRQDNGTSYAMEAELVKKYLDKYGLRATFNPDGTLSLSLLQVADLVTRMKAVLATRQAA